MTFHPALGLHVENRLWFSVWLNTTSAT